jgi:leader peptidase (prepilin peptidase)/N-methyltransferase
VSVDVGAAAGAAACLVASPYLAGLTRTVPDRQNRHWYRPERPGRTRWSVTAAVAAVLGALAGAAAGWTALWPAYLALALCCTPLVLIDYEQHRLPNRLVFAAAALAAVLLTLAAAVRGDWHQLARAAEGAAATFAVLYLLALVSPRSFGFGDVKLGAVLGGYLGWDGWTYVYYGVFAGFLLGALLAVVLLALRRATLKSPLAFGPLLVLGSVGVLAFW